MGFAGRVRTPARPDPLDRAFVLQSLIRRFQQPPLSSQFNNTARLAALENQEREFRRQMTLSNAPVCQEIYLAAIRRTPEDFLLLKNYADFLEGIGNWKEAAAQWRLSRDLIPHDFLPYFQIGRMLAQLGQHAEAKRSLEQAISIRPSLAEGWFELGKLRTADAEYPTALKAFDRALGLRPKDSMYCSYKAKVLSKLEKTARPLTSFDRPSNSIRPTGKPMTRLETNSPMPAKRLRRLPMDEAVTRIKPDFAMAHLNLGVMLVRLGRPEEGAASSNKSCD